MQVKSKLVLLVLLLCFLVKSQFKKKEYLYKSDVHTVAYKDIEKIRAKKKEFIVLYVNQFSFDDIELELLRRDYIIHSELIYKGNILVYQHDATNNSTLKKEYDIDRYKVVYYKNGVDLLYPLDNSMEYLQQFVFQRHNHDIAVEIKDYDLLKKITNTMTGNEEMVSVLYLDKGKDNQPPMNDYIKVASKYLSRCRFYFTTDKYSSEMMNKKNSMVLYRNFDEKVKVIKELNFAFMDKFVEIYSKPKLIVFSEFFYRFLLLEVKVPVIVLVTGFKDNQKNEKLNKWLQNVKPQLSDHFQLVNANSQEKSFSALKDKMKREMKPGECYIYKILKNGEFEKYQMYGEVEYAEDIMEFAHDYREDRLEKIKASQEVEKTYQNGVFVLNHDNFNSSIANITTHHDLIVLYHRDNHDMLDVYEKFVQVANTVEKMQFGRYNIDQNENNM